MSETMFELLSRHNARILALAGQLEDTTAHQASLRTALLHELSAAVFAHNRAEHTTLYPLIADEDDLRDQITRWREEKRQIESALEDLHRLAPESERFSPEASVLLQMLEDHVQLEERDLFPRTERIVIDDLAERLTDNVRAQLA